MEKENKKEELGIYNLYKTLNVLLDTIQKQSGKQLENISLIYNQKLVEIGNQFKEKDLTFSKATELTNTINNKMMSYIQEASNALSEYVECIEEKNEKNQEMLNKKNSFFKKIFKFSDNSQKIEKENIDRNIKEEVLLEKYDEAVCKLKLFKINKDIEEAIEEYIKQNSLKGNEYIENYKKNVKTQLEKIGISIEEEEQ